MERAKGRLGTCIMYPQDEFGAGGSADLSRVCLGKPQSLAVFPFDHLHFSHLIMWLLSTHSHVPETHPQCEILSLTLSGSAVFFVCLAGSARVAGD